MTIRLFVVGLGVLGTVASIAWLVGNQWRYQTIGDIDVRRHAILGRIELKREGVWRAPFTPDPQAPVVDAAALKTVKIEDLAWGEEQLVAGWAVTGARPVRGRLSLRLYFKDSQQRIVTAKDKSLRLYADWPAGSRIPFVLDTSMNPPDPKLYRPFLQLENITFATEN